MNDVLRIDLGLSENYLAHWTVKDALRELFQNAIDSGDWKHSVEVNEDTATYKLRITTIDTLLDRNTLLLGETSKTGKDTIGKFGEGYKLAALVLLRNGAQITVINGKYRWTFSLRTNNEFNVKMLSVDIEKGEEYTNSVSFIIEGLGISDYDEYKDLNLWLQEGYKHVVTKKCEVLLDECNRSKLFIGGLYVCEYFGSSLYGYNFNVGVFPLGRDRNIIDGWDASWEASRALVQAVVENKDVLNSVVNNLDAKDNEQLHQFTTSNDLLCSTMWDRFISEYPDSIPTEGYFLDERLKKYRGGKFVVVTNRQFQLLSNTSDYKDAMNMLECNPEPLKPSDFIKDFYDKYSNDIAAHYGELMLEAENWEVRD